MTARCSRASASARKVFWMMLSGAGGGFGALGRIASAGAMAASRFSGGFAGGSLYGSLGAISLGVLLGERVRGCALAFPRAWPFVAGAPRLAAGVPGLLGP